jgi:hypothetical protein
MFKISINFLGLTKNKKYSFLNHEIQFEINKTLTNQKIIKHKFNTKTPLLSLELIKNLTDSAMAQGNKVKVIKF